MNLLNSYIFWISLILGGVFIYLIIVFVLILNLSKKIKNREGIIIELFFHKVNKIPALIELMKKYTRHPDVFGDLLYLHKLWIIYNIESIYDLLDLNYKIHREFTFLIKLAYKIPEITSKWNFHYIKNKIGYIEENLEKELNILNIDFNKFNRLIKLKNISIIWMLFDFDEKIVI